MLLTINLAPQRRFAFVFMRFAVFSLAVTWLAAAQCFAFENSLWTRAHPDLRSYLAGNLQRQKEGRLALCHEAPWLQDVPARGERLREPLEQQIGCLEDLLVSQVGFLRIHQVAIERQVGVQEWISRTARLAWLLASTPASGHLSEAGCEPDRRQRMLCIYQRLLLVEIDEAFARRGLGERSNLQRALGERGALLAIADIIAPSLEPEDPPYNDFDNVLNLWGDGGYLRAERAATLAVCRDHPARIAGSVHGRSLTDITAAEWVGLRCLELWLIHQLVILNPESDAARYAVDLSNFRAAWRLYWIEFYARTDYPELNAGTPPVSERWLPGYDALLRAWIEDAYDARLQGPQRW